MSKNQNHLSKKVIEESLTSVENTETLQSIENIKNLENPTQDEDIMSDASTGKLNHMKSLGQNFLNPEVYIKQEQESVLSDVSHPSYL